MRSHNDNALTPVHNFRFQVDFHEESLGAGGGGGEVRVCSGAFAECSGFEATMAPEVIKEGGRNYGPLQRAGQVSFATVILKRGVTATRDLWHWFEMVSGEAYAYRLTAIITMLDNAGNAVLSWRLRRALPIKFKGADLNAKGTEVAIEELHLAHEGLTLESSDQAGLQVGLQVGLQISGGLF